MKDHENLVKSLKSSISSSYSKMYVTNAAIISNATQKIMVKILFCTGQFHEFYTVPANNAVTTGPITVYHFFLIKEIRVVTKIAINTSIEMIDSDRTALSHDGGSI